MMLRKLALFILPALFLVACGSSAPLVPSWTQLGEDIDGEAAGDESGRSVSLSSDGSTVAIGAHRNDGNGTDAGHVRIYKRTDDTSWVQVGEDIDGEAADDFSGTSVSLSSDGSTVAIGAIRNDGNGTNAGHVRIYQWTDDTSWTQLGMDIDGEAAVDLSGTSVSLSSDGRTVAIGAIYNDGNGNAAGHVRIYQWTDDISSWVKVGEDIDGEADYYNQSGTSVSLSSDGSTVAIGAIGNNGNGYYGGHVRIYKWTDDASWVKFGNDIDGEAAYDFSGLSVSLSSDDGSTVAIGATGNDGNGTVAGHVRIYQWNDDTTSWVQVGMDIDGEAADDYSGTSVSLSSDGSTVAIGAFGNDGNGTDAGHVRIYQWTDDTSWTQLGMDIDGEAANDWSGTSVSLSSDGSTVAIGAYGNDGNGTDAGHVRVFKINLPAGAAFGDPHFKLMNGNYMSYHGQCDILLSRIESFASGLGLEVHIRTTRVDRSVNMAYSYISGAAVRIGSDVLEVLESGMLFINGDAATAQLVNEEEGRENAAAAHHRSLLISGYKIKSSAKGTHRRIFIHDLDLGSSNHVQIRANTLTGMLTVDLFGEAFGNSEGLISGKTVLAHPAEDADNWEDTLIGVVGEDHGLMADRSTGYWNSYAESWQIKGDDNKLFHDTNRHPQYPVGCVYHTNNLRGRRLIDSRESVVSLEVARNMCAGKVAKKREYCIFDIMATGDLDLVHDPSYN